MMRACRKRGRTHDGLGVHARKRLAKKNGRKAMRVSSGVNSRAGRELSASLFGGVGALMAGAAAAAKRRAP